MDFNRCANVVCSPSIEGGYVNNPHDPGGPTKFGITLADLARWRGKPCTAADVEALLLPEAMAMYRAWWWAPIGGDSLPLGVDLIAFDAAVNQGVGTAVGFLQAAVGALVDHHIGPVTLGLVAKAGPVTLITKIADQRLASYQHDADWPEFHNGWTSRLNSIEDQATAWARGG